MRQAGRIRARRNFPPPLQPDRPAAPVWDHCAAALNAAVAALRRPFGVLEAALHAGGGHLVGDRFTVADLNVAEVLRYAQPAPELFADYPEVTTWLAACQSRPAFEETMAARRAEPV